MIQGVISVIMCLSSIVIMYHGHVIFQVLRCFRISTDGQVSKCVQGESINIFKYRHKLKGLVIFWHIYWPLTSLGQPPAFLQCGDYVYPLIPGHSPILRSTNKAYLFPDVTDSNGGNVGIMVNPGSTAEEMAEMDRVSL